VDGCFIPLSTITHNDKKPLRSKYNLPENAFVLAAFGNVYKITPDMFDTWLEILRNSPESILWLIDDNPITTNNLKILQFQNWEVQIKFYFQQEVPIQSTKKNFCWLTYF
jgi:predicted O-linked N-acetylglucosamine transferase (SPINDLY family)